MFFLANVINIDQILHEFMIITIDITLSLHKTFK